MGEATYFIRADCKTPGAARELYLKFCQLNQEGITAYDYWQAHRGTEFSIQEFLKRFPLVAEYLNKRQIKNDNQLVGLLSFIDDGENGNISLRGKTVRGNAYVWHFTDWGYLAEWMKKNGAKTVKWTSDEYETIGDYL